jgi:hypothetical protein
LFVTNNPTFSGEHDMTTKDKVARRNLSLLELATDLDNVSKTCKLMGYSRQQFYEIRLNFQTYGAAGLIDRLPRTWLTDHLSKRIIHNLPAP